MSRRPPVTAADPLPTGADKTLMVRSMFDDIAPRYDLVNRLMTFGLDVRWRRRTVDALGLPPGSVVLDLACGTGDLCRVLRRRGLRPFGIDLSAGMLGQVRDAAPVIQADGESLPLAAASVDGATCGFALRNFADLEAVLGELGRVVRPGGRIALLEVAEPANPALRAGHDLWFRHGAPAIGAALSDADAYRYLPRSIAYLPPPHRLAAQVRGAGFSGVNRHLLHGGIVQLITATRIGTR